MLHRTLLLSHIFSNLVLKLKNYYMKNLFFGASLLFLVASCGGSVDYKPSAKAMCDCMEKANAEEKGEFDLGPEVDYASCVLDVTIDEGVDLNTEEFAKQLEKDCPELVDLQKDYMESNK